MILPAKNEMSEIFGTEIVLRRVMRKRRISCLFFIFPFSSPTQAVHVLVQVLPEPEVLSIIFYPIDHRRSLTAYSPRHCN
jgi:hypothetical protein